ncbi:MAG: universal stress protein [Bacteroidota bacterium]
MKKIIVPVDFSDHSEYALEVAAQLANKHEAEIVVVHMMGLSQAVINKEDSQEVFEAMYHIKLAKKQFEEFLDKDYLEGIKVHSTVQNYKIFEEVDNVAKEFGGDLIVMGSHGTTGLREVFVGSNTEKVVRTASVPVLVVKQRLPEFEVERMVFACDFSKEFIPAFNEARAIANLLGSQLKLVYVNTPDRFLKSSEMEAKALEFLASAGDNALDMLNEIMYYSDTTVEDGIFGYSASYDADVIAVPTHGRRGLAHFFNGSIGEEMVNHSKIPVITFKI